MWIRPAPNVLINLDQCLAIETNENEPDAVVFRMRGRHHVVRCNDEADAVTLIELIEGAIGLGVQRFIGFEQFEQYVNDRYP